MPSDALIVAGQRVPIPERVIAAGCRATNPRDDGEPRFACRPRTQAIRHFVLHETCGATAAGCKRAILQKNYGVQLILGPDGALSGHGDLARDRMVHANQLNDTAVGIEIVSPYSPLYARPPFGPTIPAQWWTWVPEGGPRRYVLPTPVQMAVLRVLVPWLCAVLAIPYAFPTAGLGPRQRKIPGWNARPAARPGPGVVAHRDFAEHADARYLLEDLIAQR
jgi:hypothetical protein